MSERRAELDEIGAVHVEHAVDAATCAALRQAIDDCRRHPSEHYAVLSAPDRHRVDSDLFRWFDVPAIRDVLQRGPLPKLAGELLGTAEVILVEDQWFASEPGADTPSPWHQDGPYYNIDGEFVTIWLALDDAPAGAALAVVPGSHRWGTTFAPVQFVDGGRTIDVGEGLTTLTPDVLAANPPKRWDVAAGDVIALHSLTLHSAGAEPVVDHPFRRFSTRWARPDARYVDRGEQAADFWRLLPHGLHTGDSLACPTFPLISVDS